MFISLLVNEAHVDLKYILNFSFVLSPEKCGPYVKVGF